MTAIPPAFARVSAGCFLCQPSVHRFPALLLLFFTSRLLPPSERWRAQILRRLEQQESLVGQHTEVARILLCGSGFRVYSLRFRV